MRSVFERNKAWICFLLLSAAIFAMTKFMFTPLIVQGHSMDTTLASSDIGICNRLDQDIARQDIVIVRSPDQTSLYIKRAIGLPGDTIESRDNVIYIDGQPLDEPYLDPDLGITEDFGPFVLEEDEYFLLGDNRLVSADSRIYGPFKKEAVIGKWAGKLPVSSFVSHHTQSRR